MSTLKQLVDEITNIKNELITCHTNLKNNLVAKGVEVSNGTKMLNLINKVGGIELGRKWATGSSTSNSLVTAKFEYAGSTSKVASMYYDISSLSFKPSTIVLFGRISDSSTATYVSVLSNLKDNSAIPSVKTFRTSETSFTGSSCIVYNFKVGNDVLLDNNVYRIPISYSTVANINLLVQWVAYE